MSGPRAHPVLRVQGLSSRILSCALLWGHSGVCLLLRSPGERHLFALGSMFWNIWPVVMLNGHDQEVGPPAGHSPTLGPPRTPAAYRVAESGAS